MATFIGQLGIPRIGRHIMHDATDDALSSFFSGGAGAYQQPAQAAFVPSFVPAPQYEPTVASAQRQPGATAQATGGAAQSFSPAPQFSPGYVFSPPAAGQFNVQTQAALPFGMGQVDFIEKMGALRPDVRALGQPRDSQPAPAPIIAPVTDGVADAASFVGSVVPPAGSPSTPPTMPAALPPPAKPAPIAVPTGAGLSGAGSGEVAAAQFSPAAEEDTAAALTRDDLAGSFLAPSSKRQNLQASLENKRNMLEALRAREGVTPAQISEGEAGLARLETTIAAYETQEANAFTVKVNGALSAIPGLDAKSLFDGGTLKPDATDAIYKAIVAASPTGAAPKAALGEFYGAVREVAGAVSDAIVGGPDAVARLDALGDIRLHLDNARGAAVSPVLLEPWANKISQTSAPLAEHATAETMLNQNRVSSIHNDYRAAADALAGAKLDGTALWRTLNAHANYYGAVAGVAGVAQTAGPGFRAKDRAAMLPDQTNLAGWSGVDKKFGGASVEQLNDAGRDDEAITLLWSGLKKDLADPNSDPETAVAEFKGRVSRRLEYLGRQTRSEGLWGWRDALGNTGANWGNIMGAGGLALALYAPIERQQAARRLEKREDERYDEDWERQKELMALQNGYRLQQIGAAGEASAKRNGSVAAVRPARF